MLHALLLLVCIWLTTWTTSQTQYQLILNEKDLTEHTQRKRKGKTYSMQNGFRTEHSSLLNQSLYDAKYFISGYWDCKSEIAFWAKLNLSFWRINQSHSLFATLSSKRKIWQTISNYKFSMTKKWQQNQAYCFPFRFLHLSFHVRGHVIGLFRCCSLFTLKNYG